MLKKKTFFFVLISLIPLSFILTQCYNAGAPENDPRGQLFAGSESCVKCHSDVYNSYQHTAHFQTTRSASADNIKGSFAKGFNILDYGNGLHVAMEKRGDSLYQVGYMNNKQTDAEKFEITVGLVNAQTYLYWKDSQLFELPVSYFTALHGWANSPGYDPTRVNFQRPILRKCLECHTSYISDLPQVHMQVGFDKASLIYGIDCERCHGPAANHVNYHTAYPDEKKPKYITTYASLTRGQKMDACAVCHSGTKGGFLRTSYGFHMGDTLSKFKEMTFLPDDPNHPSPDVHGNQSSLLPASKCFIMSKMDCNTCHDPHMNQEKNIGMFTQKCLSCHSEAKHNFCKMASQIGAVINNYCINCHMPQQSSHVIMVGGGSQGKTSAPYLLRNHHIAVYPEETQKVLDFIKTKKI